MGHDTGSAAKAALVTGGARRIGAAIATALHAAGFNVAIHCRRSQAQAQALADTLNRRRPASALTLQADLAASEAAETLVERAIARWGRLDALINNASSFYPTPVGTVTPAQWADLMGSNLKAPFFLSQAAAPALRECRGAIINLADIHGMRPLRSHPVYCAAKAGLVMLTRSLALELGPHIRVNAIAPGAILWPEQDDDNGAQQQRLIERLPLQRLGSPDDIAAMVRFLVSDEAAYVTGQVIGVDGGRGLESV